MNPTQTKRAEILAGAQQFKQNRPGVSVKIDRATPRIEYSEPSIPVQEGAFAKATLLCADYFASSYQVTAEDYLFYLYR